MPKKQLTSNRERRAKLTRRVYLPAAAVGGIAAVAALTLFVESLFVTTGQGATIASASSSSPAASTTITTTLSSPSLSAPTTTIVTRTEVLETNPCVLVKPLEVLESFKSHQSHFSRVSVEEAPPAEPLKRRVCEFMSLSNRVSVTTLEDDGQFIAQARAAAREDQYYVDEADKAFAAQAAHLGKDAFRTLDLLYFKVKAVTVVVNVKSSVSSSSLTDYGAPMMRIGALVAGRLYTLE